jgi:hypothetical protein
MFSMGFDPRRPVPIAIGIGITLRSWLLCPSIAFREGGFAFSFWLLVSSFKDLTVLPKAKGQKLTA